MHLIQYYFGFTHTHTRACTSYMLDGRGWNPSRDLETSILTISAVTCNTALCRMPAGNSVPGDKATERDVSLPSIANV